MAYLDYVERPSFRRYFMVLIAYLIGLMAKSAGVTLPVILLILDYWPLERIGEWKRWRHAPGQKLTIVEILAEKVPIFGVAGLISVVTFLAQKALGAVAPIEALPLYKRPINAVIGYWEYIKIYFWPNKLALFYPREDYSVGQIALAISVMVLISATVFLLRRRAQWAFAGWLWFVVTLLPMIGLIQVGSQAYADRYLYIPGIGLAVIVAHLVDIASRRTPRAPVYVGVAGVVILGALGVQAHRQTAVWKTGVTVFSHSIQVTGPTTSMVTNLGISYLRDEKAEPALYYFNMIPDEFRTDATLANRASALLALGKTKEGIEMMEKSIQANSNRIGPHAVLALCYKQQGDIAKALAHYDAAFRLLPKDPKEKKLSLAEQVQIEVVRHGKAEFDALRSKTDPLGSSPVAQAHNLPGDKMLSASTGQALSSK
jgi:MFS family permease